MEIYSYISPFIAAMVASGITYFFTIRAKKHEFLTAQRIIAFKAIQRQLVSFKRYYNAFIGEHEGNEFAPRPDNLSPEDLKSPLEQRELLDIVLADNLIFLSTNSRERFNDLESSLSMLCNFELWKASDLQKSESDRESRRLYESMLTKIDDCIEEMYKDLKLPK